MSIEDRLKYITFHATRLTLLMTPEPLLTKKLLEPFQQDPDNRTLLQYACFKGYDDTVSLLLSRDVSAYIDRRDKYGFTALGIACMQERFNIVAMLLNAGATVYKFEHDYILYFLNKSPLHYITHNILTQSFMRRKQLQEYDDRKIQI